jgi:hypothetical protein
MALTRLATRGDLSQLRCYGSHTSRSAPRDGEGIDSATSP